MDELFLGRAFTGKEPHQVGLSAEALDHLSEHLQALLLVHRARIEEHDLIRGDAELTPVGVLLASRSQLRTDRVEVDPVGQQQTAGRSHTFGAQFLHHGGADAAHTIKAA